MTALLIALFVIVGLVLGLPLFVLLGVATLVAYGYQGDTDLEAVIEDIYFAADKEILLAIPLFVLAGQIMTHGSIAHRLIRMARSLTAALPSGLAVASVLACALFAAISGSSPVTLIAVGSMMYPAMVAGGYPKRLATGVLTAGGTLGIILPPSIPMIIFAIMASVSVTDMFIAGILPGLLLAFCLAAYAMIAGRHIKAERWDGAEVVSAFQSGVASLLLPVIVLGGIYTGFFTPTEAAAIAVGAALVVEVLIYGELSFKKIWQAATETASLLGMIFFILLFAVSFNKFLILEQVPQSFVELISASVSSKLGFLLGVNLLLLAVGCVMDVMSAILVLAPLLTPMAVHYGIHPIHFGIIMIVNLEIGYLTPPVGINLFVASAALKEPLGEVIRASVVPMLVLMFALFLICAFPQLALLWVQTG